MGTTGNSKNIWLTARKSAMLTGAAIVIACLALSLIPGPSNAWAVPENLPHQGGYAADNPGLRPVNALEWCFLRGSPFYQLAYWSLVLLVVISWHRGMKRLLASTATAVLAFSLLWATQAPTVRHRCMSPNGQCAANLKNLGTAMEFFKEEDGRYALQLSALLPEHIRTLPSCPLTGESYHMEPAPVGYTIRCRPHPRYYFGKDCTSLGKNYLSLKSGGEVLSYSSEEGILGFPGDK